jgi:hypothetical protein
MRVLIACESSGETRRAMATKGADVISCDLLPADDGETQRHVIGDVVPLLSQKWDLVIAHPPCTRLCNSGVRWLHERNLWDEMREAAQFFTLCLNANSPCVAVENPVMHKHARAIIGRGPDFTVQPWQFGDDYKKRTCFWTRGLPALTPTSRLDGSTAVAEVHRAPPGPDRWKVRSKTYPGIAKAMADQWLYTERKAS